MARDSSVVQAASEATTPQGSTIANKTYEFSAPQYYDFARPSPGVLQSESWFGTEIIYQRLIITIVIENPHSSRTTSKSSETPKQKKTSPAALPITVTQIRKRISENNEPRNSCEEKNDGMKPMISPQIVAAPKRSSNNVFEDANSLSKIQQSNSYEKLFSMTKKKEIRKNLTPKLGKVRTPDRVKLERLKTAAPLLPTRSTKPLTVPVEFNFSERTRLVKSSHESAGKLAESTIHQDKKLAVPESPKLRHKTVRQEDTASAAVEEATVIKTKPKGSMVTVPLNIHLATSFRRGENKLAIHENDGKIIAKSCFKATPIPSNILQKATGIPPKRPPRITVPESPNILKPLRRIPDIQSDESIPQFKAKPVPIYKTFQPMVKHEHSESVPINLPGDVIAEEKRRKFKEALKRERKAIDKARQFRARSIPNYEQIHHHESSNVTSHKIRPLTKPEPFQLLSELRHKQYQEAFQHKLIEEQEKLAKEREFHSRPAPHISPFLPKKSTKPLTQTADIKLHSSERAVKRREFDEHIRHKEQELAELEQKLAEERKIREQEEIKELRKRLVPKVRPVMHYAPITVKPAEKKLTVPVSPPLKTTLRSRKRNKDQKH